MKAQFTDVDSVTKTIQSVCPDISCQSICESQIDWHDSVIVQDSAGTLMTAIARFSLSLPVLVTSLIS